MSVIGSNLIAGASAGGASGVIQNSIRFRSDANAYMGQGMTGGGTGQAFTASVWVKRGALSGKQTLLYVNQAPSTFYAELFINTSSELEFVVYNGTTNITRIYSYARLLDPSAWYHVVLSVDSALGNASLYLNGELLDLLGSTKAASGQNCYVGGDYTHTIGSQISDFTLAHYILVSDQELPPTDFGQYLASSGSWAPKSYLGTYGTNGFRLLFERYTAGTDSSGNANNFSFFGIQSALGIDHDYLFDVPVAVDRDIANYMVFRSNRQPNPGTGTMTYCNLGISTTVSEANVDYLSDQPLPLTGRWYFTVYSTSYARISLARADGTSVDTLKGFGTQGVGIAIDMDTGYVWSDNLGGGSFSRADATAGINPDSTFSVGTQTVPIYLMYRDTSSSFSAEAVFNFGQQPFSQSQPDGFAKLNTFTLAQATPYASSVPDGSSYFYPTRYIGNGTSQTIDLPFYPGLIWGKATSTTTSHRVFDVVRGVTNVLTPNAKDAETTESGVTDFVDAGGATGFTVGSDANLNANTVSFATWNWAAGGAPVSNTAGSITSQVSASVPSGFSIASYTGTGASGSIGHGLGAAPELLIVKTRDSGTQGGVIYSGSLGSSEYLQLFADVADSQAVSVTDANVWGTPTSTVFSVGSSTKSNALGEDYIAYCFASVPGYSKVGTYTGTGAPTPVFLGFKPAFILVKNLDASGSAGNWTMVDKEGNQGAWKYQYLIANTTSAETGSYLTPRFYFYADGMAPGMSTHWASGFRYIYLAVAENPFTHALSAV